MKKEELEELNSFGEFIVKQPLYDKTLIEDLYKKKFKDLQKQVPLEKFAWYLKHPHDLKLKEYCKFCKEINVFEFTWQVYITEYDKLPNRFWKYEEIAIDNIFILKFICTYCRKEEMYFLYKVDNWYLIKIWQYPSVRDLSVKGIGKYKKILEEYYDDLKKSLIIKSHWYWVAAFTYLRRVSEKVLFDIYRENKEEINIEEDDFRKKDFEEKIKVLKRYLPEFLVQTKISYWILSKWIHELSEEECKSMFDVIYNVIKSILDDIISKRQEIENKKKLKDELSKINNNLKNTNNV